MAAIRRAATLDQARVARQLPRAEADLVSVAAGRPRQRREPARVRTSGVRRVALARVLDSPRDGDRVQARVVPARAAGTRAVPARQAADPPPAPLWHPPPGNAGFVRGSDVGVTKTREEIIPVFLSRRRSARKAPGGRALSE